MKANKVLQFIILLFLLVFLVNSLYNYTINTFILKTDVLYSETFVTGHQTYGFMLRQETLVRAQETGTYEIIVKEGQRVARRESLATRQNQPVLSPASGIVSFEVDGFEEQENPFEQLDFIFDDIINKYQIINTSEQLIYEKNDVILKVYNNLNKPQLYLEAPLDLFDEPLRIGMVLGVIFDGQDAAYRVRISDLKGVAQEAMILADFIDQPKGFNRIQPLKIVTEEKEVVRIPRRSVVVNQTTQGIYVVERGFISFREIIIIEELHDFVLAESFNNVAEFIINPRFATEGRFIR